MSPSPIPFMHQINDKKYNLLNLILKLINLDISTQFYKTNWTEWNKLTRFESDITIAPSSNLSQVTDWVEQFGFVPHDDVDANAQRWG